MGANMRKIISILLSILLIVTINQTNVLAEDNVIPKDSKGIEYQVYSPEFPDAYIIINEKPRKMRASTFNVLSNSTTLNEVTATVFVEEEYDVVDGENVIIKSKLLSKDINLNMNLYKNRRTGNGNTAEAVLKYIHTYSGVKGTISISAGSGGISGGFSLSNIEKQWSIVCTVTGIPY